MANSLVFLLRGGTNDVVKCLLSKEKYSPELARAQRFNEQLEDFLKKGKEYHQLWIEVDEETNKVTSSPLESEINYTELETAYLETTSELANISNQLHLLVKGILDDPKLDKVLLEQTIERIEDVQRMISNDLPP
jgi:hypothetical protein